MKKILVIGDSCTDIFRYGICERLTPEAPVPVFKPTNTSGNGGMTINVFENLKALGAECDILTNDIRPVKTRYVDEVSNQMIVRIDESDNIKQINFNELEDIEYDQYQAIVISDYNKGYLSEDDIEYITDKHPMVFMDTKKKIGEWASGVEVIKINEKEFNGNGAWVTQYYEGELVVTLGKKGAKHWFSEVMMSEEHNIRDLSGAGDTFFAALIVDYLKNNDIRKAIDFANKCAGWVVTQKGVVTVELDKI